jgi:archaellum biogenesis ATPase FlaH
VEVEADEPLRKRVIRCKHGAVEFLATGQQCVVEGTHPSGARYEWTRRDPAPRVRLDVFEALWSRLQAEFGVEAPVEERAPVDRAAKLHEAAENDPVARFLMANGWVKSRARDGGLNIRCPFEDEHTTPSGETTTRYWLSNTWGFKKGNFKCLHAHCMGRRRQEFLDAIGYTAATEFEDVTEPDGTPRERFKVVKLGPFLSERREVKWLIKGVLPKAELGMIYGESGSGKSFFALDMAMAIARGVPKWRDHKVTAGGVVYVAAEGTWGLANRLRAYHAEHKSEGEDPSLGIITDAPNFLEGKDHKTVIDRIKACDLGRPVDLVIVDTLSRVSPGANENSSEDMGAVLAHCKAIHEATGAMVLLVHHSGKDASRGARGHSSLHAACETVIEVAREGNRREACVTKSKEGEDFASFAFSLVVVGLGMDEDGDVITSCAVRHEKGGGLMAARNEKKWSPRSIYQRAVWAELQARGGECGEEDLVQAAVEALAPPADGRDRRKELVVWALANLAREGRVTCVEGVVRRGEGA